MKKTIQFINLVLVTLLFTSSLTAQTLNFNWERSQAKGTLPTWFAITGGTERGMAHSASNNHLYIVSRTGTASIYVLDANTGENIQVDAANKKLNITGVAGGAIAMSDIECDDDGVIFVANVSGNTEDPAKPFKVYMWSNEDAAPVNIISYSNALLPTTSRTGDHFTLTGKVSDNSAKIYATAKSAGKASIICWTTADFGTTWTPELLFTIDNTSVVASGANASIYPIPGSTDFMYNENAKSPARISNTGALVGVIVPAAVTETNSNRVRAIVKDGKTYLLTFTYNYAGTSGVATNYGKVVIADITDSEKAVYVCETSSLGTNKNSGAGGNGDIDFKDNGDGTYTVYVLGSDNGIGATTVGTPILAISSPVEAAVSYFANVNVAYKTAFAPVNATYSYVLDAAEAVSVSASPIALTGLAEGAHKLTLTMYNGNDVVVSKEVNFTVTIPTITITTPDEMQVFTTSSVNVEYTTDKAPTGATYKYSLDAAAEVATTASPITLTSLADGDHSVTINMYNGTTKVATKTVNFKVALPKVTITKPTEAQKLITNATAVEFTTVSEPVDVNFTYILDGAAEVAVTASPFNLADLAEGDHAVTVKMYSAETFVTSHKVNFTVAVPKITITNLTENQVVMTDNYDVEFTVVNAPEGVTYGYFLDAASAVAITGSPIHLLGIPKGPHSLAVNMYNGETIISRAVVHFTRDYTTGIANELANSVRLYPNPATSVLNIEGENIKTIAINNLAGQTILTFEANNQQTVLDVQSLENGIYFVKVLTNQGNTHVQKFVKQ